MAERRGDILDRLLERHGLTFGDELGIRSRRGGPDALFQLLVGSLLMSARINASIAVAAGRELFERGYTDARAMAEASWQDRVDALGAGGYVRYDESTATYLGDAAERVIERYDGDLRGLRAGSEGDPGRIHTSLQGFKGIGPVGADIFCRDVQAVWDELRPFADRQALEAADALSLGSSARQLADTYGDDDLSLVAVALVRAARSDDLEVLRTGADAPPTQIQLAGMTRDELYDLARRQGVAGRSRMSRDELVAALRRE